MGFPASLEYLKLFGQITQSKFSFQEPHGRGTNATVRSASLLEFTSLLSFSINLQPATESSAAFCQATVTI